MRPLLVLLAYNLFKNDPEKIIDEAISVEVFHNFTLVHDDIMDNAPLRRGKATVHEKWNASTAILSGDVMMVKAYVLLKPGRTGDAALTRELQDHVKAEIAPYKYPRAVEYVSVLPRTDTGKLKRHELRARAEQDAARSRTIGAA